MSRLEHTLNKPVVVLVVGVVAVALNVLLYFGYFLPRMTPLIAHLSPIGVSVPEAISKLGTEADSRQIPSLVVRQIPRLVASQVLWNLMSRCPIYLQPYIPPPLLPPQLQTHLRAHLLRPRSLSRRPRLLRHLHLLSNRPHLLKRLRLLMRRRRN